MNEQRQQQQPVTLDDVQFSTWSLFRLLDTIVDQMLELDYGQPNGRNHALDRVYSLVTIARDVAHQTAEQIDGNYHAIRSESHSIQQRIDRRRQDVGGAV